jgi:integrase
VPYFQDKTIQEITDFDVESYKIWRNAYWVTGEGSEIENIKYLRNNRSVARPKISGERKEPNYSTVNKELTILREIFEFARLNRKIDGREIPAIKNVRKPKNANVKQPGLTAEEVEHLLATLADRYYGQNNIKHKRHLKLLIHYIAFMCLTGLRVSETKNLKLSDCESFNKDGKDYLKIFVRGKGKSRELIGLNESATTLEKLKIYHRENADQHGWEFSEDMCLFVDQYGRPVNNFSKGLNRAFEEAGLLFDKHGLKRNAGAFRKYYITTAILSGVDYMQLAKQCGTSANVIERYYSGIETFHQPEKFIFNNALTGVYDD